MSPFDRAVYAALRPGGLDVVLDHVAAPGSLADLAETLHRIEPSDVHRQVQAAGFIFEGESSVLMLVARDPLPFPEALSAKRRVDSANIVDRPPRHSPEARDQF